LCQLVRRLNIDDFSAVVTGKYISRTNEVASVDDSRSYPGRGPWGHLSADPRGYHVSVATRFPVKCGRNSEKYVTSRKDLQSGAGRNTHTLIGSTATYASFECTSWARYTGCAHSLLITLCISDLFGLRVFRARADCTRHESSDDVCVRIPQGKGPFLTLHDACLSI
jgi:hypothetical protein